MDLIEVLERGVATVMALEIGRGWPDRERHRLGTKLRGMAGMLMQAAAAIDDDWQGGEDDIRW